ncbi:MAG: OmpH family outer membrane protein [Flavobacteriaceae bacterium]|nr:OmpH family outer membrane protein [Flavobacteriaceae bacterium]
MIKNFISLYCLLFTIAGFSQKGQKIAYVDINYILENLHEYKQAEVLLDEKVTGWNKKLDELTRKIEIMKTDLENEKPLLTTDLIEEREEDIVFEQDNLNEQRSFYFGPQGDMFFLNKQLVEPILDLVYNSINDIAKKKKYDFVFSKSSDLILLYNNKKYDISTAVINKINKTIVTTKKKEDKAKKISEAAKARLELKAEKKKILETKIAKKKAIAEENRKKRLAKKNPSKKKKDSIK